MGITKKTFFVTTKPLEEIEFFEWKSKQKIIDNWKSEPTDKELFKNDEMYSNLLKSYFKSKKELDDYKFNKRNNG